MTFPQQGYSHNMGLEVCNKVSPKLSNNMRAAIALGITVVLLTLISGCGKGRMRHVFHEPPNADQASNTPDAIPRIEPKSRYGNPKSYEQFGKRYWVLAESKGYEDQGIASWYGKKFHGRRTSSGETYDMYQMTAAHKTLPIPSYVEVTNLRNGRRAIVRVNDRGPFHQNRIIDLSYVAAQKLDIVREGTGMVEVRAIDPANPVAHKKASQPKVATQQTQVTREKEWSADRPESSPTFSQTKLPTPTVPAISASSAMSDTSTTVTIPSIRDVPVASAATSANSQPVETRSDVHSSTPVTTIQEPIAPVSTVEMATLQTEQAQPLAQQLFVQLGAFSDKANADRLRNKSQPVIQRMIFIVTEQSQGQLLYKVRVGPLADVAASDAVVNDLNSAGIHEHKIVFQ